MKNTVIWIMLVTTHTTGTGVHAQSLAATPLSDSAQRAAIALAKTPSVGEPVRPQSAGNKCAKAALLGTAGGALVGFGAAFVLLKASGGSDSAAGILKGFAVGGGIGGLMVGGAIGCK